MAELLTQLDGATNVLLAEPPLGTGREACTSLLVGDGTEQSVLFVSYTRQASACVDQLADENDIADLGVITVGDASPAVEDDSVVTETISTPSDLTGLGIEIGQFLSEFDAPVTICFDSLTSMLQYVDVQTAYEFLHAVTGQVHAADARAHFHIDPSAHSEEDVAGIASLFDARVSLEDDEHEVDTRSLLESGSFS